MMSGASISDDGVYRYRLWRVWEPKDPILGFVMLNPSTADARADDPTIRRCLGFARSLGYGGINVVNLFAWRATNPLHLWARHCAGADIIGPDNREHTLVAVRNCRLVICAWGSTDGRPAALARAADVVDLIRSAGRVPMALAITRAGDPRHPLYLPGTSRPEVWSQ